ncbi:MAG: hypothetical protein ACRDP6_14690 [Actinoallomurus sp.]
MAVALILCRHRESGVEVEIPETGLKHLSAYEPVDPADRERLGYDKPADGAQPEGEPPTPPPSDPPAPKSKPATGAAKTPKE